MKLEEQTRQDFIKKINEKNFSIYDVEVKYGIKTMISSKIISFAMLNISDDNFERINRFIKEDFPFLKENTEQKVRRQLTKLLSAFQTRKNLAKHLDVNVCMISDTLKKRRNITNEEFIKNTNELYEQMEKQNFSIGDMNILKYIDKYSFANKKKAKQDELFSLIDPHEQERQERLKVLKENKKLFKRLSVGGVYEVKLLKHKNVYKAEESDFDVTRLVIVTEYKRFYLGIELNGTQATILKNDLYLKTTKVKRLDKGDKK